MKVKFLFLNPENCVYNVIFFMKSLQRQMKISATHGTSILFNGLKAMVLRIIAQI